MSAAQLRFRIVDVFAAAPFAGNPLAVVLGGEDLPAAAMQTLAREFNLSETAFPLPPAGAGPGPAADYRLRIFTPTRELPFAGHPSIGAAWVLRDEGLLTGAAAVQECGAGLLPLRFLGDGAAVELTGGRPVVGEALLPGALTAAVNLPVDAARGLEPRWAGSGIDFAFLEVAPDAVARCTPDVAALRALGGAGLCVFARSDRTGPDGDGAAAGPIHARVFAVGAGVPEDPATGSAALALGAYLVAAGVLAGEGSSAVRVAQGAELGRPSLLEVSVDARGGVATACRVAGTVHPVAHGVVRVPPAAAR